MSWTINGQSPASLNLRVLSITQNSDTASEAVLAVVAADYTQQEVFNYDDTVSIEFNGSAVFTGTVFQTPRSIDSATEGLEYILKDPWYELERLVFQVPRRYVQAITPPEEGEDEDSTLTFVTRSIGTTTFEADVPLGSRIATIIGFAASSGLNIQAGSIEDGIGWYRTEDKDRSCAEMIREFLRLMPDFVAWIDSTTTPASFNLTSRAVMPQQSYALGTSNITGHSVVRHDSERIDGCVIRYEKPITVDSENYTELTEDIAGSDSGKNVFIETVGLVGGVYQNEYALIKTDTIPQIDADTDKIKEWWIEYTPQLLAIKEIHGDELRDFIKLAAINDPANDVKIHTTKVVVNPLEKPEPINKNAVVVPESTDPKDYPRHIIEGTLPEWAGKRYRPILAEVTMGVLASEADTIADAGLKASILDLFNVPKTFDSKAYLTALLTGKVTGTNAVTKNYKRAVTANPGETPPIGIAAELLAQLNLDRYSGSITVVGQDVDTISKVGQRLNLNGGRAEWATMGESFQSVTHDIQEGSTSITFGPTQNLGANDLIDRMRANRANQFGFGVQSGQNMKEGIGGNSATPSFNFSLDNGAGGTEHPWKVSIVEDSKASILKGKAFDGLYSITELTAIVTTDTVAAGDVVCLEYTYATEAIKSIVVASDDYEPFTDDGEDPPVILTSVLPIAKIVDSSGTLKVEQMARNNFGLTSACVLDGTIIKSLTAI